MDLPNNAPQWVTDLAQDLETIGDTVAECSHERAAYRDSARMVIEYWEQNSK